MTVQILIVEDELEIANAVKAELDYEGYEVSLAHDGFTGLSSARQTEFDLILLDWMLPGLTGVEICRRLRQTANNVPIIFLTAQDEIGDRVNGLDAGANDYLTKPFSIEELLARVRSTLRRAADNQQQKQKNILKFANLKLDLVARTVYQSDRSIDLTTKEFNILQYFLANPKQVLSRQQILDRVWSYEPVDNDRIVEVHVRHIRQKLEAKQEPRLIQTVRGIGYILQEN
ncbi:MAG: response regulator transcription factor [Cyanobacteria bacterium P01_A01_bin.40]